MPLRLSLRLTALLLAIGVVACGPAPSSSPPPASPSPHDNGHAEAHHDDHLEGAHAPLVHRFQTAEQWAREFDDPTRDEWQKPQEVVASMKIESGMIVADLGAGTGYFEPWLSRALGPTGSVLALDVEPDMVRY